MVASFTIHEGVEEKIQTCSGKKIWKRVKNYSQFLPSNLLTNNSATIANNILHFLFFSEHLTSFRNVFKIPLLKA